MIAQHPTKIQNLIPIATDWKATDWVIANVLIQDKILNNSASAIEAAIKSINANFKDGINGFEVEIEEFGKCFGTADFKEGTTAFLEKRKPNFRN